MNSDLQVTVSVVFGIAGWAKYLATEKEQTSAAGLAPNPRTKRSALCRRKATQSDAAFGCSAVQRHCCGLLGFDACDGTGTYMPCTAAALLGLRVLWLGLLCRPGRVAIGNEN